MKFAVLVVLMSFFISVSYGGTRYCFRTTLVSVDSCVSVNSLGSKELIDDSIEGDFFNWDGSENALEINFPSSPKEAFVFRGGKSFYNIPETLSNNDALYLSFTTKLSSKSRDIKKNSEPFYVFWGDKDNPESKRVKAIGDDWLNFCLPIDKVSGVKTIGDIDKDFYAGFGTLGETNYLGVLVKYFGLKAKCNNPGSSRSDFEVLPIITSDWVSSGVMASPYRAVSVRCGSDIAGHADVPEGRLKARVRSRWGSVRIYDIDDLACSLTKYEDKRIVSRFAGEIDLAVEIDYESESQGDEEKVDLSKYYLNVELIGRGCHRKHDNNIFQKSFNFDPTKGWVDTEVKIPRGGKAKITCRGPSEMWARKNKKRQYRVGKNITVIGGAEGGLLARIGEDDKAIKYINDGFCYPWAEYEVKNEADDGRLFLGINDYATSKGEFYNDNEGLLKLIITVYEGDEEDVYCHGKIGICPDGACKPLSDKAIENEILNVIGHPRDVFGHQLPDGAIKSRLKCSCLSNLDLRHKYFRASRLSGFIMDGVDLSNSFLMHARLEGASLKNALFVDADARFVNFMNANLAGAMLFGGDFRGANFKGSLLEGVILTSKEKSARCIVPDGTYIKKVAYTWGNCGAYTSKRLEVDGYIFLIDGEEMSCSGYMKDGTLQKDCSGKPKDKILKEAKKAFSSDPAQPTI